MCARFLFKDFPTAMKEKLPLTHRESWILSNFDLGVKDPMENAKLIDPGFPLMTPDQQAAILKEVETGQAVVPQGWLRVVGAQICLPFSSFNFGKVCIIF